METYDRVGVTVGLFMFGLVVFLVVDLPAQTFRFMALGSPVTVELSEQWLRAMLAAGFAVAGAHSVVSAHPLAQRARRRVGFTVWIVPGVTGLLAPVLLAQAPNELYWMGGLGLTAVLMVSLILLEYYVVDPDAPDHAVASLGLNLLTYAVALVAFVLIYRSRARSLITATATSVAGGLMALRLLQSAGQPMRRTALYAALVSLVMGESAWALNYWRIHALTGGVLLLLFFYVSAGVAHQHLQGSLTRRVLIEFLAVAAVGVWLLLRFGLPIGS